MTLIVENEFIDTGDGRMTGKMRRVRKEVGEFKAFAIRNGQLNGRNPALNNELTKKPIETEIERALTTKGLTRVTEAPDLNVFFHFGSARRVEAEAYPAGWRGLATRVVRVPYSEGSHREVSTQEVRRLRLGFFRIPLGIVFECGRFHAADVGGDVGERRGHVAGRFERRFGHVDHREKHEVEPPFALVARRCHIESATGLARDVAQRRRHEIECLVGEDDLRLQVVAVWRSVGSGRWVHHRDS
jgi:hypothetical protein